SALRACVQAWLLLLAERRCGGSRTVGRSGEAVERVLPARPPRHCRPRTASLRMWQYFSTVTQKTIAPPPAATETAAIRKAVPARTAGPPFVTAIVTAGDAGRVAGGRVASAVAERRGAKAIGPWGGDGVATGTSAASSLMTWSSNSAARRRASLTRATAATVSRA